MAKYLKNYVNQQRTFMIDGEADVTALPTHAKNTVKTHMQQIVAGVERAG